jgi:hypothetical protein
MNIADFYHICPPSPFSYAIPPLPGTNSPDWIVFTFLSFIFLKKTLLFFMMIIQGVSLWHFQIYVLNSSKTTCHWMMDLFWEMHCQEILLCKHQRMFLHKCT